MALCSMWCLRSRLDPAKSLLQYENHHCQMGKKGCLDIINILWWQDVASAKGGFILSSLIGLLSCVGRNSRFCREDMGTSHYLQLSITVKGIAETVWDFQRNSNNLLYLTTPLILPNPQMHSALVSRTTASYLHQSCSHRTDKLTKSNRKRMN